MLVHCTQPGSRLSRTITKMGSIPPPPPYYAPAPRKDNTLKVVLIVLAVVAFLCLLLVGVFAYFGYKMFDQNFKPVASCQMAMEDLRTSLKMYAKQNGDKLPPAATWQEAIKPYLVKAMAASKAKKEGFFSELEPTGVWTCGKRLKGTGMTGLAYNSDLAGKKLASLQTPLETVMVFEVPKSGAQLGYAL